MSYTNHNGQLWETEINIIACVARNSFPCRDLNGIYRVESVPYNSIMEQELRQLCLGSEIMNVSESDIKTKLISFFVGAATIIYLI